MLQQLKRAVVLGFCLMMSACITLIGSGDGSDESKNIETYLIEHDSKDVILDPSYKYDVNIEGDNNRIVLKGDSREVLITGSYNYVIIEDDTYVDELSITGMNNIVTSDDEQALFVALITLSGNRNVISIDGYDELLDSGEDNQILNTDSIPEQTP